MIKSPNREQCKKFKAILKEFLWNGKKAQISYERLVKSYEKGGLKLADLELKDIALKCKWVQSCRLHTHESSVLQIEKISNLSRKDVKNSS